MEKSLRKLTIFTDSTGRLDRRDRADGKQEVCDRWCSMKRSLILFNSACFAVPSYHKPNIMPCQYLPKHAHLAYNRKSVTVCKKCIQFSLRRVY